MIEMPPLQFAQTNGIRMGFYEAGPKADHPPVILCHGWPEIAFSWRHQIKALAEAGIRVIAPDQRGYGATDRPEPVEAYDLTHLTGDLVGLLDHLGIDKAIFVGHDWGGFVVWQMPLRHLDRVAGVVGVNTPHTNRAGADPIELLRTRFGEQMYIVQFQDPTHAPDKIFNSRVEQTFDAFMRKPVSRGDTATTAPPTAGVGASPKILSGSRAGSWNCTMYMLSPKRARKSSIGSAGARGLCGVLMPMTPATRSICRSGICQTMKPPQSWPTKMALSILR